MENSDALKLTTQRDAIKYFIEKMDIEMIDMILSNENTYQDLPKETFIQKLSSAFNEFKKHGDDYLEAHSGQCNNCFTDKTGYIFIGNNSNNYMSILFDVVAGEIKDLAECSDFKTNNPHLKLNERVFIDELGL
jgi:hypothetical protein